MDGEHFDSLVKRLTQTRLTRWEALRGVLASAVVGLTAATRTDATAAKKQTKQSKQSKQSKQGKQPKRGSAAGKQGGNKQGGPKGGTTKQGTAAGKNGGKKGGCRDNGQALPAGPPVLLRASVTRHVCAPRLGCQARTVAPVSRAASVARCNCFGQVCAAKPATCQVNGSSQTCSSTATGRCAGDGCCQPPANQCNTTGGQAGLCRAPNCSGKQCGPDGCGNGGTCGDCLPGQTCNPRDRPVPRAGDLLRGHLCQRVL